MAYSFLLDLDEDTKEGRLPLLWGHITHLPIREERPVEASSHWSAPPGPTALWSVPHLVKNSFSSLTCVF